MPDNNKKTEYERVFNEPHKNENSTSKEVENSSSVVEENKNIDSVSVDDKALEELFENVPPDEELSKLERNPVSNSLPKYVISQKAAKAASANQDKPNKIDEKKDIQTENDMALKKPKNKKNKESATIEFPSYKHKSKNKKLDFCITFTTGLLTLAIIVLALISGFKWVYGMFDDNNMLAPDNVENAGKEVNIPPFVAPTDFLTLKNGDMIYAGPISNIAQQDMPDFKSADDISDNYLLSFGIWQVLSQGGDYTDSFTQSDGTVHIPFDAVSSAAHECFNFNRELPKEKITVYAPFDYSAENKSFITQPYGIDPIYFARVQSVSEKNGQVLLTCEYVTPSEQYAFEDGSGQKPAAKKTVLITIKPSKDSKYKILSLKTQS
ncbi:MAG: hypothetical protein Q8865_08770 [Bacillota bacterium]|nr:hypothetical protein [Bacillota bacterium]